MRGTAEGRQVYIPRNMSAKPTLNGRELSNDELERIRADIERFDTICVIDDEVRKLVSSQWMSALDQLAETSKNLLHRRAVHTWALLFRRGAMIGGHGVRPAANFRGPPILCSAGLGHLRLVHGLDAVENLAEIALRDLNIVVGLQVQPKLRRCTKRLGEPKCGIGGNAGLLACNPLDSSPRQTADLGKSACRHLERKEELLPMR